MTGVQTCALPISLKQYAIKGEVKRLDGQNKTVTIKLEAIGDWMGAMTM